MISLQIIINLIGALGPELAFDALWYHLTLPKIYLLNHSIFHIPGGLLYYSDMPKLTEMLYIPALTFSGEILAKIIHFFFGILVLFVLYKISLGLLSKKLSLMVILIFYSNLVVGWESITAYIDLSRTFFAVMSLWGFLNYLKSREKKWFVLFSIMIGLEISTKILAFGSLFIFGIIIIYDSLLKKEKVKNILYKILSLVLISILIPLPWFIFSYINTGNPFYPLFTPIYQASIELSKLINPFYFLRSILLLFTRAADPISPIYIIFLPLIIMLFNILKGNMKIIAIYSFLSIIIWYVTPNTGGGRFIIPYLPAFSILVIGVFKELQKEWIKNFLLIIIIIISIISIFYRGIANKKYIPYILGMESKDIFLTQNLNFKFGDFYDVDGYFKKQIKSNNKVLIYGVHNLYYVSFPFIHESYAKKGDKFNYILIKEGKLPDKYKNWELIYKNGKTGVTLFSLPEIR